MISDKIFSDFKEGRLDPFYGYFYPGLLQYARRYLVNCEMYAEDCVQNAIYKAWQRNHTFDSLYALKAFIYITIRNEIVSIHRNRSVKERFIGSYKDLSNQDTFINTIIDQEARTLLYNYILNLPEREKQVCILSYIEGLGINDIAETLNISPATVKRDKSRALAYLRRHLKETLILIACVINYKN